MSRAHERGRAMRRARPRPRMVELRPLAGSTAAQSRPVHHVGTQCRRSTPAALQLADVDSTRPAAAGTSNALARAAARQLADRAVASKPAELRMDATAVSDPPGTDARPPTRSERVTAALASSTAARARFSLGISYSATWHHAPTRAATSRGSETC